jgi:hypothetical protein
MHSYPVVKKFRSEISPCGPDDRVQLRMQHEGAKNLLIAQGFENFPIKLVCKIDLARYSIAEAQPD